MTHRGPVMDFDVLASATGLLFAGVTPNIDRELSYSFGWGQLSKVRDQTWDLVFSLFEKSTVKEIFE